MTLTPELQERCVPLCSGEPREQGEFVLYWAHHALRAHDNPALDAAAEMALQIERPLLVYQGLGGRHRYNSDRHHRFILEAARDFKAELEAVGLRLHFHLPENPVEPGPLQGLLQRSAVVVTELYPVPPFRAWYAQHVARHPGLPWLQVDASCILPMTRSEKAPTRAFQFRRTYQDELFQRVERGWPPREEWPCAFDGDPGFEPFDLASPLDDAIAACRIDHSIPAVADTVGGSAAGYRRWARYLDRGLDRYHALRNDAALPNGVSRLSAY
ncbi:MAG: deoxyribodipyrimidine photo-lyase, partial [Lysobacterales bacterium]